MKSTHFFAKFLLKPAAWCGLLGLLACEPPLKAEHIQPEKPQTHLLRGLYAAAFQLDPLFAQGAELAPIRDLFDGLMGYDRQGNIVPFLARQHFSQDGKSWLFILDEQARWSHGEPITAADVVASWQRLIAPATQSPYANYLVESDLLNAQAILHQALPVSALGVSVLNAHTLKVELHRPNWDFPKRLIHHALLPTFQGKAPTTPLISSGGYELVQQDAHRLRLKAREAAFPFQQVTYQRLVETAGNEFDLIENPMWNETRHLHRLPRYCNYFYEFNLNDPWVGQKSVRQAIKAMLSPMEISQQVGIPNHWIVLKQMLGDEERQVSAISSEHHLESLNINASNPLKLSLSFSPNELNQHIAMRIVRSLSQSELFKVNLQLDHNAPFQLRQQEYCAPYADPRFFVMPFHSKYAAARSGYYNPQVDQWLDALQQPGLSPTLRREYLSRIAQQLDSDIAVLPLFQSQRRIVIDPSISGIDHTNHSDVIYSKDLSRKP